MLTGSAQSGSGGSSGKRRKRENTPLDLTLQTNNSSNGKYCNFEYLYVSSNCYGRNRNIDCNFISTVEPETTDSQQNQARHYKVLQELYKSRPRPNKKDVAQLLDLEYQATRAYIVSDVMKEQDRPTKVLQAYPCFREVDHVSKSNKFHRFMLNMK